MIVHYSKPFSFFTRFVFYSDNKDNDDVEEEGFD